MKIGDRIKIHDPHQDASFDGLEGEIIKKRNGPLPWGVKLDGEDTPPLVWFNEAELEIISNDES
jgi:hypothetical protein